MRRRQPVRYGNTNSAALRHVRADKSTWTANRRYDEILRKDADDRAVLGVRDGSYSGSSGTAAITMCPLPCQPAASRNRLPLLYARRKRSLKAEVKAT